MNNAYFRDITEEDEALSPEAMLFVLSFWPMIPFDAVYVIDTTAYVADILKPSPAFDSAWQKLDGHELNPYVYNRKANRVPYWTSISYRDTTDEEDEAFRVKHLGPRL